MILQNADARRFQKLFYGLLDSVAPSIDLPSTPRYPCERLSATQLGDLVEYIWGTSDSRDLIDDFVTRNPLRFNRTDLHEVQSWKDGLYGIFFVVREGRNVLFLNGTHALAIRGIRDEIDQELDLRLPTAVWSLVLPFGRLLTHGTVADIVPFDIGADEQRILTEAIAQTQEEGRLVTTARDFLVRTSELQNGQRALVEGSGEYANLWLDAWHASVPSSEYGTPVDQFPGALAGLSAARRAEAIEAHDEYVRENLSFEERQHEVDDLRHLIKEECTQGPLAWTLKQAMQSLDSDRLRLLAERHGLPCEEDAVDPDKLVRALAQQEDRGAAAFLYEAMLCGPEVVSEVHDLYKADGLSTFYDYRSSLERVPHAAFPALQLFYRDQTFSAIMPREVRDALSHASWDDCLQRAKALDEAYLYLGALQDMRGVVPVEEALDAALAFAPLATRDDLLATIDERLRRGWGAVEAFSFDGGRYFVESMIMLEDILGSQIDEQAGASGKSMREMIERMADHLDDVRSLADKSDHATALAILREQQGKPPCEPSREIVDHGVTGATLRTPEAEALIAYLDEHVPEGQDDYAFATDATRALVDTIRTAPSAFLQRCFERLRKYDFVPTREQLDKLIPLLGGLGSVVPRWALNGWTAREAPFVNPREHTVAREEMDILLREEVGARKVGAS